MGYFSPFFIGFSYVAVVRDSDGSAFITKAEFDSLKNNFQSQIDSYNQSIDSKVDGAIAQYLAGISLSKEQAIKSYIVNMKDKFGATFTNYDSSFVYDIRHIGLVTNFSDFGTAWNTGTENYYGVFNHANADMNSRWCGVEVANGETLDHTTQADVEAGTWSRCIPMHCIMESGVTYWMGDSFLINREGTALNWTSLCFNMNPDPTWLGTDLSDILDYSSLTTNGAAMQRKTLWNNGASSGMKSIMFLIENNDGNDTAANKTEKCCFPASGVITSRKIVTRNTDTTLTFDSATYTLGSYGAQHIDGETYGPGYRKVLGGSNIIQNNWAPYWSFKRPKLYEVDTRDLVNYDVYSQFFELVKLYEGIPLCVIPENTTSFKGTINIKTANPNATYWPTGATTCNVYIKNSKFGNINPSTEPTADILWKATGIPIDAAGKPVDIDIKFANLYKTSTELYIKIVPNTGFANVYSDDAVFSVTAGA